MHHDLRVLLTKPRPQVQKKNAKMDGEFVKIKKKKDNLLFFSCLCAYNQNIPQEYSISREQWETGNSIKILFIFPVSNHVYVHISKERIQRFKLETQTDNCHSVYSNVFRNNRLSRLNRSDFCTFTTWPQSGTTNKDASWCCWTTFFDIGKKQMILVSHDIHCRDGNGVKPEKKK